MRCKAMYKSEIAAAAGVSRQTLRNWMKTDRETLAKMGVSPNAKIMPPLAVKYLCEKYVIDI